MLTLRPTRRKLLGLLGAAPIAATAKPARAARPPVLLLKTRVNGECYYDAALAIGGLAVGDPVQLRREPTNRYDSRAIEVLDRKGRKLGYIARVDNSAAARLIDAGEALRATVARLDKPSLDIRIDVEWLPG
ncbi:hypothetical protein GON01_00825 [Sphingomonas sp. MAH-20]|jgi:hypothetical protein|uniref:HIRAN domain-containing protein n=1 Tax=Sphingomonas horti TaxID=2682842 RepID=A0A6I4IWM9_9SPHN|nr:MULTISPECIES: HIRAN domain-containing protein [Sphingomonas]MBA2920229.1 HIRAN domain-containing protein [Sphingomonas sp. CGMCC 1.13658]MVO76484.1 hypothetical protein [Sphingomonas horti]